MATSHIVSTGIVCIRAKNKVSTRLDQLVVKNFSNRRPPSTNGSCPLPTFSPYFSFPSSTSSSSYTSCSSSPPSTIAAASALQFSTVLCEFTRSYLAEGYARGRRELCGFRLWQPETCPLQSDIPSLLCHRASPSPLPPSARRSFPRLANFWYVQQFPVTGMLAATGQKLLGISRLSAREPMYGAPRR